MCGIIGAVAERNVTPILVEGLKRLEYRGYDSAGVAVINNGKIERVRRVGKVEELERALQKQPLTSHIGIAHTRWATHGQPSEANAHPHISGANLALVHNGIIENYVELKEALMTRGYQFSSETDTEVIVHMLHELLQKHELLDAVQEMVKQLRGAYALAIIDSQQSDRLIAVRHGSPLIIGMGIGEHFIASDHLALLPVTQKFIFLEDGDFADVRCDSLTLYNQSGEVVERPITISTLSEQQADKGTYRHYMLKEIYEQPIAINKTLEGCLLGDIVQPDLFGAQASEIFAKVERIQIIACGTSYHSGLVARYWLEHLANIPCQVEIASEYRYRTSITEANTLFITLSQSGETADTLSALRKAKQEGILASLAICNVPESSLVRESDLSFITKAGPEVGVASTKAFTTQLTVLLLFTAMFAEIKATGHSQEIISALRKLATQVTAALNLDKEIATLSEFFAHKEHTLFLGRGVEFPIALEGALKLKEISYIHAEAYPAGELKHGPLALIDENMPVVAIAPNDNLLEKLLSNLQEVKARGGELIIFADQHLELKKEDAIRVISMPEVDEIIAPIIYTVPLQLLAYHVAVIKGTDVDQPRNLAKSVTVE